TKSPSFIRTMLISAQYLFLPHNTSFLPHNTSFFLHNDYIHSFLPKYPWSAQPWKRSAPWNSLITAMRYFYASTDAPLILCLFSCLEQG
ncbi:hypothetical protein PJP07_29880, partial [Mycobacterium kansasii]